MKTSETYTCAITHGREHFFPFLKGKKIEYKYLLLTQGGANSGSLAYRSPPPPQIALLKHKALSLFSLFRVFLLMCC
jgi:hypothetical protein